MTISNEEKILLKTTVRQIMKRKRFLGISWYTVLSTRTFGHDIHIVTDTAVPVRVFLNNELIKEG